jgi:S-(hydroxymethyl)glutathione dehydrogenase/alcohol dehydrogenase
LKYQAAVLHCVGEPLRIEELELAKLRPSDVLVRIGASGLCHSDLEVMQGSQPFPLPIVLGHEGAGTVVETGAAVNQVRAGDRVVCSWNPHCGHCFFCERGQPILCEPIARQHPRGHLPDGEPRYFLQGRTVHHFTSVSSHAEYCVVPESGAIRVPQEIPYDRACLIGCAVMTGVGAVARLARVQAGASVAVIGAGAVGLNVVQGAVIEQAQTIIVVDTHPERLALARAFGATHTIQADTEDAVACIADLTTGRGADYVFECAGNQAAMQTSLEATRRGGQLVILGKVNANQQISLRFGSLMGDKRIVRSSYGGARPRRDFPWLARLYLEGKLRLDPMITERLPLARINDGFDIMRAGRSIRSVIVFDA